MCGPPPAACFLPAVGSPRTFARLSERRITLAASQNAVFNTAWADRRTPSERSETPCGPSSRVGSGGDGAGIRLEVGSLLTCATVTQAVILAVKSPSRARRRAG